MSTHTYMRQSSTFMVYINGGSVISIPVMGAIGDAQSYNTVSRMVKLLLKT